MSDWTCPHGIGPGSARGDCGTCNATLADRSAPGDMTGDERAAEVIALLNEPNAYRVGDIHGRIDALVGRPTWTHEFATDTRLAEEARGALPHPTDLGAHLIESAKALTDAPVIPVSIESRRAI